MPTIHTAPNQPLRQASLLDRPLQWPEIESSAIQQWRDLTTGFPRRNAVSRREHRENHASNTDTCPSDAGCSSCDDSASSGKKPRDVASYLKYLVRGFLKQYRATSLATDTREIIPNKDSFIPSPKIAFLIDSPTNLICQICQQTPLKMAISAADPDPSMIAILPCGHICCHDCSSSWLADHDSCPFCRIDLIHPNCKHKVQPRLIAQDTIHTVPETLPNGGAIGKMCFKCTEKCMRQRSVQLMTNLAGQFKRARSEAVDLGTKETVEDMRRAQEAFERVPEDVLLELSRIRHHQW
ncbi:hypothetical protein F4860DRAFT_395072 [Xylaria cubensis]|nr:hypothetical protein F4860DRAFT_395072 [Xylaria cubensis]